MGDELNLYEVAYTVHRRRLDGKEREHWSSTSWDVGAADDDEAIRKTVTHVKRFGYPEWVTERVEVTGVERLGTLRRCGVCREFRADDHRILCVCSGPCCKRCGKPKIHRRSSSYYDERDGHLWNVPWFATPLLCHSATP